MTALVNSNGAWRETGELYVKQGGLWREAQEGYVKQAGAWREFHSSGPEQYRFVISRHTRSVSVLALLNATPGFDSTRPFTVEVVINRGVRVVGFRVVFTESGNITINNSGTIQGGFRVVFTESGNITINNSGTLYGFFAVRTLSGNITINNSGTIQGSGSAVSTESGNITINNSGTIQGSDWAVVASLGSRINWINRGTIIGRVYPP